MWWCGTALFVLFILPFLSLAVYQLTLLRLSVSLSLPPSSVSVCLLSLPSYHAMSRDVTPTSHECHVNVTRMSRDVTERRGGALRTAASRRRPPIRLRSRGGRRGRGGFRRKSKENTLSFTFALHSTRLRQTLTHTFVHIHTYVHTRTYVLTE